MTAPITASAVGQPPTQSIANTKGTLGKDEFLTLLVAQLKNQDPLNPTSPEQTAAQLAQFSSVEQLVKINEGLAKQAKASSADAASTQLALGSTMLGKRVIAAGDTLSVRQGAGKIYIDPVGQIGKSQLTVRDTAGKIVKEIDLGSRPAGRQAVDLSQYGLPDGRYTYTLAAQSTAGADVPVATYVLGIVDAVRLVDGRVVLGAGDLEIPLGSVIDLSAVPSSSSAGTPTP